MFHSAAVRLTIWYLAIIMTLSLATSIALYNVSSNHLEQNAKQQTDYFSGLFGPQVAKEFESLRQKQVDEDRGQLKANLAIFNLLILVGGGAASYGLARRTLRPIEEALEAQIRFTADASHELRTPLATIQTENEVALRSANLTKAEAVALLKRNLEEAAKLKDLSEGLLALAYTSNEDVQFNKVELGTVINEAKKRVIKAAKLKKITISLPNQIEKTSVMGDQNKLIDLLVILLDNAVKYSPEASEVKVSIQRRGKQSEVSVSDSGRGIKKADLSNIFERFYRADQSRNKQEAAGYGLGLAIAKKIADQHHGVISVRSAVGKGSVFTLRLHTV